MLRSHKILVLILTIVITLFLSCSDDDNSSTQVKPSGTDKEYRIDENGILDINDSLKGILSDAIDFSGRSLSVAILSAPEYAVSETFEVNPDGTFFYEHNSSEKLVDHFRVTLSNGQNDTTLTITIKINPLNDEPAIGTNETFRIVTGTTLDTTINLYTITDADRNDTIPAPYGNSFRIELISDKTVQHGVLTLNADGTFSYVNDGNSEITEDSFTYVIIDSTTYHDSVHTSEEVTVKFTIGEEIVNRYIGSRSSHYGFKPFPEAGSVAGLYTNMAQKFENGVPSAVWIVGGIDGQECSLEFPKPRGESYDNIVFWGTDKHEEYLTEFDKRGVKVFLQVEAGMADMKTLIKLVLDQYGHHPSVAGFGADIEWYPSEGFTNGDVGGKSVKLDTTELREWDNLVKSYNPEYRVFVKHWIPEYCGPAPISDVIYINDTQGYPSKDHLVGQFKLWADHFYPNELGFQIGYPKDTTWWTSLEDPLLEIGNAIDETITEQVSHLFWVDFTIYRDEMKYLWP